MDWNKYNILGVIQARGGSKGIPKKNIKDINGKPLISYTISEALKTKMFNHFVVSSDDENILDALLNLLKDLSIRDRSKK